MSDLHGAEPAYAPYLRFARNVLLVDLAMGVAVLGLSWKQGWTSAEESTAAIFGAGAVLLGLAVLPSAGPLLASFARPGGWVLPNLDGQARAEAIADARSLMQDGITLTLLAAGAISAAYAAIVSLLFLS